MDLQNLNNKYDVTQEIKMSFVLNVSEDKVELKRNKEKSRAVYFDGENKKILVGFTFHEKEKENLSVYWCRNCYNGVVFYNCIYF